ESRRRPPEDRRAPAPPATPPGEAAGAPPPESWRHPPPKRLHEPNLGPERRNHCGRPHPKPRTDQTWGPNTAIIAAYRTQSPARTEPGARTPQRAPQTRPTTGRARKPRRARQTARRGPAGRG